MVQCFALKSSYYLSWKPDRKIERAGVALCSHRHDVKSLHQPRNPESEKLGWRHLNLELEKENGLQADMVMGGPQIGYHHRF